MRPASGADTERYIALCGSGHGPDGRTRTQAAGAMTTRPTGLTNYLMESMKDGDIYWVAADGIEPRMPAFGAKQSEADRWQMVVVVREPRARQCVREKGRTSGNCRPASPFRTCPRTTP